MKVKDGCEVLLIISAASVTPIGQRLRGQTKNGNPPGLSGTIVIVNRMLRVPGAVGPRHNASEYRPGNSDDDEDWPGSSLVASSRVVTMISVHGIL